MNISDNDKVIFLDVLTKFKNHQVSKVCADYFIKNTPENRDFLIRMEEAIGDPNCPDEWKPDPPSADDGPELCTMDWLIMTYFIHLMENDKL